MLAAVSMTLVAEVFPAPEAGWLLTAPEAGWLLTAPEAGWLLTAPEAGAKRTSQTMAPGYQSCPQLSRLSSPMGTRAITTLGRRSVDGQ
jgi:hypothetical protein